MPRWIVVPCIIVIIFKGLEWLADAKWNCWFHSVNDNGIDDQMYVYLKSYILLYADDTVLLCENANDLQNALYIVMTGSSLLIHVTQNQI